MEIDHSENIRAITGIDCNNSVLPFGSLKKYKVKMGKYRSIEQPDQCVMDSSISK